TDGLLERGLVGGGHGAADQAGLLQGGRLLTQVAAAALLRGGLDAALDDELDEFVLLQAGVALQPTGLGDAGDLGGVQALQDRPRGDAAALLEGGDEPLTLALLDGLDVLLAERLRDLATLLVVGGAGVDGVALRGLAAAAELGVRRARGRGRLALAS